jgi:hypothetical protein
MECKIALLGACKYLDYGRSYSLFMKYCLHVTITNDGTELRDYFQQI